MCSFCLNFAKLCGTPGFWKNVLDSFSSFYIKIALNSKFVYVQENEHTPGTFAEKIVHQKV